MYANSNIVDLEQQVKQYNYFANPPKYSDLSADLLASQAESSSDQGETLCLDGAKLHISHLTDSISGHSADTEVSNRGASSQHSGAEQRS